MTEYEEITNGKDTSKLIKELEYQFKLGYNINDSFPQHIIDCIHQLNSDKKQFYIQFRGIDDWNRPVYKVINKHGYLGSTNHLFPNKNIAPNNTEKEINDFFRKHISELEYFGSSFNCEPLGGLAKDVQLIIID